ncbi:hypothetical protein FF38_12069 [Lucilia cuprina]|uniref:Uncharacterized protein n=1 Tax=Lucilia cuprina TaxID=7375 RepID=A0A0L0BPL5_LUCCU|nr:hypothetical protein FF38_12069 [Lucilia cuprina]
MDLLVKMALQHFHLVFVNLLASFSLRSTSSYRSITSSSNILLGTNCKRPRAIFNCSLISAMFESAPCTKRRNDVSKLLVRTLACSCLLSSCSKLAPVMSSSVSCRLGFKTNANCTCLALMKSDLLGCSGSLGEGLRIRGKPLAADDVVPSNK